MKYICIGKQKIVLFSKYKENGWVFVANALREFPLPCHH
jgi:hypothetical protein